VIGYLWHSFVENVPSKHSRELTGLTAHLEIGDSKDLLFGFETTQDNPL